MKTYFDVGKLRADEQVQHAALLVFSELMESTSGSDYEWARVAFEYAACGLVEIRDRLVEAGEEPEKFGCERMEILYMRERWFSHE